MQCTVEYVSGSKAGKVEEIDAERIAVGRNPTNNIQFDPQAELDVSGDHAQLMLGDDGRLVLTDLNSRNGTFLNDQKIGGAVPCPPGSAIQFGKNGPKIVIHYTPGPKGGALAEIDKMKGELDSQKQQAAKSQKKTMTVAIVVVVLMLLGGGGFMVYSSHKTKVEAFDNAKTAATEEKETADKYKDVLPEDSKALAEEFEAAEKLGSTGDYEGGRAAFDKARKDAKQLQQKGQDAALADASTKAQLAADAKSKELLDRLKAEADAKDAAAAARLAQIENDANANKDEIERLRKQKTESQKAKAILESAEANLCYLYVETYVQAEGSKERSVIAKTEGTGFVSGDGRITTAKHIAQVFKYNPEILATAKKIKDEHQLDVKTYIEVWMLKNKKFTKVCGDGAEGTAKLASVSKDAWVSDERDVTIQWNQVATKLKVKPHDTATEDLAVIAVVGAKLTPVGIGPLHSVNKGDLVVVVGASKGSGSSYQLLPVQSVSDSGLMLNSSLPPNYGGAPVYALDGKCIGVVGPVDGQSNVTVFSAENAQKLKSSGGSTAPAGN